MSFFKSKLPISPDALKRELAVWNRLTQHWRRMVLAAIPMVVVDVWTSRNKGAVEIVGSLFFVVACTVLLSWGFERQVTRQARMWRTIARLESITILWSALNWLGEWALQSIGLAPADPDSIPTSARGLGLLLFVSQFQLVLWYLLMSFRIRQTTFGSRTLRPIVCDALPNWRACVPIWNHISFSIL